MKRHEGDVHFICKLCGEDHKSDQDLMVHLKRAHAKGSNYLLCGIDGYVKEFTLHQKFRYLYTHIRKHHCTLMFSCDVCQTEFTSVDTLRNHISIQHNEGTISTTCFFKCPHCDKEVQYARKLQMHIDQRHKCPKCDFVTQRTPDLRKHIQQTHEELSHQCVSCKFETFSLARLKKHQLFCHKLASKRDLQCRYCKKPFPFQINKLRRHELMHSDVANYLYDKCDFKTKTAQGLKNHSLYHE